VILSGVTGTCVMIKKDVFNEVGGFDEKFVVAFNDVDICLKIRDKKYLIVYTPCCAISP
jgi:GT2 family glycosyltransferase